MRSSMMLVAVLGVGLRAGPALAESQEAVARFNQEAPAALGSPPGATRCTSTRSSNSCMLESADKRARVEFARVANRKAEDMLQRDLAKERASGKVAQGAVIQLEPALGAHAYSLRSVHGDSFNVYAAVHGQWVTTFVHRRPNLAAGDEARLRAFARRMLETL